MSFSTVDEYSAPTTIPSHQELAEIIADPETNALIRRRFAYKASSAALIRNYNFVSQTIEELEEQLDRHHKERELLHDLMFESRSFRARIRPIVGLYRHRNAQRRRGFHPYS